MSWTVSERKKKSMSRLDNVKMMNSVLPKFESFKSMFLYQPSLHREFEINAMRSVCCGSHWTKLHLKDS